MINFKKTLEYLQVYNAALLTFTSQLSLSQLFTFDLSNFSSIRIDVRIKIKKYYTE